MTTGAELRLLCCCCLTLGLQGGRGRRGRALEGREAHGSRRPQQTCLPGSAACGRDKARTDYSPEASDSFCIYIVPMYMRLPGRVSTCLRPVMPAAPLGSSARAAASTCMLLRTKHGACTLIACILRFPACSCALMRICVLALGAGGARAAAHGADRVRCVHGRAWR